MKLTFEITFSGETDAGFVPFTDTVTVEVESGNPGGEPGEFTEYMRQSLQDWYGTPCVKCID